VDFQKKGLIERERRGGDIRADNNTDVGMLKSLFGFFFGNKKMSKKCQKNSTKFNQIRQKIFSPKNKKSSPPKSTIIRNTFNLFYIM
jgi:hypothetical protein